MNIIATIPETFADGPGIRYSIYAAGCKHYCKKCHNPESWNFEQGTPIEEAWPKIKSEIEANPMLTGITITGGDPMMSPFGLFFLLHELKVNFPDKDIWVYTGYTIEQLDKPFYRDILKYIDTLVDGKYEDDLRNTDDFKGSTNQRIIENPYQFIIERA